MFYQLTEPIHLDGKTDYLDLTEYLYYFLNKPAFRTDIVFQTSDPGYVPILAVYYKESLLPSFSLSLAKGRTALTIRRDNAVKFLAGGEAVCDGNPHLLSFRGKEGMVEVWMDGELVIEDRSPGAWCQFDYVGFVTLGRGTCADNYTYFKGDILSAVLSDEDLPLPSWEKAQEIQRKNLFEQGFGGVENYRIPSLLTVGDTTIASIDARMEANGDNPNHICRALRVSRDSGETWSDLKVFCDYGGTGRHDGAAAIDGSLLYDEETDTVFMLFSHTSAGIGAFRATSETAFDAEGRKLLKDRDDNTYYIGEDRRVYTMENRATDYTVGAYGELFEKGEPCGSICHGKDRLLRQMDASFLQLIQSKDRGQIWSDPVELNPLVKAQWMRFVGAGPGTGIQLKEGQYKGRLLFPVYYLNQHMVASSGVIYSDDHGVTWHMGKSANDGRILDGQQIDAENVTEKNGNLGECQVVELEGGIVRIFLRNGYGPHTLSAYSRDGGESWYDFHETQLVDPQCQSHVLRICHKGKDMLLFSNPADAAYRVRGTVRASFDGGKTWPVSRLVEPGEFGYSCLSLLPDGRIGLLYEGQNISQRFIRFSPDWLME